jgi:hypothetical protein
MKRPTFSAATVAAATVVFCALNATAQDQLSPPQPAGEIVIEEEVPANPPPAESPAEPKADTASPEPTPGADKPSAELIIDAEEAVVAEPALEPGEEPLPPVDGSPIPGEMNIFGTDLFGPVSRTDSDPADFTPPPRLPDLQDPQEQQRKMRVRFRQIKARLDRDPQLVELQAMAEAAGTPEDRRAARRAYYTALFERTRNIDKSLTEYTEALERAALARLGQTRIEPTVPNNPPPPPLPRAEFMPTPQYPPYEPAAEEPVALP